MNNSLNTHIIYCDETGDDGNNTLSSQAFVLTSLNMSSNAWKENFERFKQCRKYLRKAYGFSLHHEIHTSPFITDKNPYRPYGWDAETKRKILHDITYYICKLDISVINVVIDKTRIKSLQYPVLENALKYNIQRIENSSNGCWNYLMITDPGRTGPMRKTAREIRAYNPIPSNFGGYQNKPIELMIEDILEKDSKDSYFIQICDFISYFAYAYYKTEYLGDEITGRASKVISKATVKKIMEIMKDAGILNLKASHEKFGLVIYPTK